MGALLTWLENYLGRIRWTRKPPTVDVLTFSDVLAYFHTGDPGSLEVKGGGLLRRAHRSGHLVFQFFLDREDHVCVDPSGAPYGRTLVARSFDLELSEKFTPTDLIIFR